MKHIAISVLFCSLFIFICGCETNAKEAKVIEPETKVIAPESEKDSVSYLIGTSMARSLMNIKDEINLDMLLRGIKDQFDEKPLLIGEEKAQTIMREFSMKMEKREDEKDRVIAEKNVAEGNKFLEENKKKEGVIITESGLQYLVLKQGDGPKPEKSDMIEAHYRGTTIDGTEFDSSYKRGEPAVFPVTGVIKGWTEALLLMNAGSKYKLFIPSELAYGQRRAGPVIGPNSVLIFEIELLGIKK